MSATTGRKSLNWTPNHPDTTGWKQRHLSAITAPKAAEVGIVNMLKAWLSYADSHQERYESGIGDDGVLGPQWAQIGSSLRMLLNGEAGRLDCGTLDSIICDNLTAQGFDPDTL